MCVCVCVQLYLRFYNICSYMLLSYRIILPLSLSLSLSPPSLSLSLSTVFSLNNE